ncbi:succinoglycan biosynthesis protein exoa [Thermaurantimonas aggregans]|uniref:Succinoglycan biosynthesis protein exoa n=1 Tax=Thermaurantimonas aggregans TaxID=2173829 RepID=A0A401XJW8_9FLAO|nr:glycosyltransferase family 2 protein [Thermaurantimonas aggregans]GCD77337.1 succinoglycan biosynthesis protein exoa [Thermaurantimonas aggregans]
MKISVICPCLNEEKYIENILSHFVKSLPYEKELFIVDGGSTDLTIEIVKKWTLRYSNIFLLNNHHKFVPFALNKAIPLCKGNYIVRIDAHTEYAEDYYEKIIEVFEKVDADIVGGPMRPVGETYLQKAIAYATSSIFGIGDSKFHNLTYEGYTDSVYLGAWKKSLFDYIGFFDENLKRNQDDEFHYRAKSYGKKIYLSPKIVSYYYPRKSLKGLFKQYFEYGLYKPLVLKKVPSEWKIRHFIPSLFVIYLISTPLCFIYPIWIFPFALYSMLTLLYSFKSKKSLPIKLLLLLVFPTIHISYGLGFIIGLKKIWKK